MRESNFTKKKSCSSFQMSSLLLASSFLSLEWSSLLDTLRYYWKNADFNALVVKEKSIFLKLFYKKGSWQHIYIRRKEWNLFLIPWLPPWSHFSEKKSFFLKIFLRVLELKRNKYKISLAVSHWNRAPFAPAPLSEDINFMIRA